MKRLTKAEAKKKYPGVRFAGPVQIGDSLQIGDGVSIGSNVRIGSNVQIGNDVSIGAGVSIGHDVSIGAGVSIGDGVSIGSNVSIGKGVLTGSGVSIGKGAVVGNGAVIHGLTRTSSRATIPTGARISRSLHNVTAALAINGIGNHKKLSAIACDAGLIIHIGCMNDYQGLPPDEARKEIAKKYSNDHPYFMAIDLAERWYETIN